MRNLKNIRSSVLKLPIETLTAAAWDPITDSLLCASGPSGDKDTILIQRWKKSPPQKSQNGDVQKSLDQPELQILTSWDNSTSSGNSLGDKILNFHYFADDKTACLVLTGGDIIIVREEPQPGEEEVEIVGSVDAGITAAEWSPDEEILAISTHANSILLMTRDFESAGEIIMITDDLRVSKHVSVGWGKAETQFKGKRARALRDPTIPENVDSGSLSPLDNGQVTISWRGDGAFVAISTIDSGQRRVIRVYTREGHLDSVSEPVDGLEGALSWRPAGNLMAGIQRKGDQVNVVFFERNGLRHGQFGLRLDQQDMNSWGSEISLKWNLDSTVLAISFQDRVQLWTMGNYHYYMKQEIKLPGDHISAQPALVTWHASVPLKMVVSLPECLAQLEYAFVTAGGSTIPPDDLGVLAVIDGCVVKLTSLRLANIPPPMASHEVTLASPVVDVAVSRNGILIAALSLNTLDVFEWFPKPKSNIGHRWRGQSKIRVDLDDFYPQQIAFLGDSNIFISIAGPSYSMISQYLLDQDGLQFHRNFFRSALDIIRILPSSDHRAMCIEDGAHQVIECRLEISSLPAEKHICRWPATAPWIEVIHLQDKTIAFGLLHNGSLYANERLLAKNCTSMSVTSAHLIFTTTQHLLKFVHITNINDLAIPADEPEKDERCRSIERGARLISVMPSAFSVTLQMPRGNLETIYPRALVVARIRQCIAVKDYKSAFYACRNQRVDMNILYDHAPEQFLSSVGLFVDQIGKVEHIDLFLSQLREEDVTITMYKDTLPTPTLQNHNPHANESPSSDDHSKDSHSVSKVNKICDAMLAVLLARMPKHLQNVITAHVCKVPPDLISALMMITTLRGEPELLERAVEHICFLADVNQLYDQALGLYDLDLTLTIAQQSQKDPREYLPFLQNLHQMPLLRRQFSIDDHLGRYQKALGHLRGLDHFGEFKEYMIKHQLYQAALNMYKLEPENMKEIMTLYAGYLESRSRFKEAGLAYEFVNSYKQAMEVYRAAGCWREALFCASQASMPQPQIDQLAMALADSLFEIKDYTNAASLYLEHGHDVEKAASTLCKGYQFAEAMRLVVSRGEPHLLDTVIDHELGAGMASTTELLADCKGQINAQVPRLRELRANKEKDPLAYYAGITESDIPDNVSIAATDTSTSASLFTRYTNHTGTLKTNTSRRTSKNRRREERKRARGKKGSIYEEEYLVNSIRRLIDKVNGIRDEITRLIEGLLRRRMWERAMAVERAMKEVVDMCQGCIEEVFEVGKQDKEADHVDDERPPGADGVLFDRRKESNLPKEAPVVQGFEKMTLLRT